MTKLFRNILLVFVLVLGINGYADVSIDSLQKKLIEIGSYKLDSLQKSNEQKIKEGKLGELNFVLNLNAGSGTYLVDYQIPGTENFITTSGTEAELNQRLQDVYTNYQKECYLILISCLEVKVTATAPDSLTISDVFGNSKFYNENSNIDDYKNLHEAVVLGIVNSSLVDKTRQSYLVSIGRYRGAFQSSQAISYFYWFTQKIQPNGATSQPYFQETYDYLKAFLRNSPSFKQNPDGREYLAREAVNAIESSAKNAPLKAQLLSTYTSSGIHDILAQFGNVGDYTALTVKERIHILSVLVTEGMFGDWWFSNDEEGYALRVIKSTPTSSVEHFLDSLALPSSLNNNAAYTGDKSNTDILLKRLIDHTDDGIQENNYKELILAINQLIKNGSKYNQRLQEILQDDKIIDRTIIYSHGLTPAVGTVVYSFDLKTSGEVSVSYSTVTYYPDVEDYGGWVSLPEYGPSTTYTLNPYDLVAFSTDEKVSFIDESVYQPGAPDLVPAVFLKYVGDKQYNDDAIKVASIAADVATIASGVGAFAEGVSLARRAWVAFEVTNAIGNITLNLSDSVPPQFEDAVNYSNMIMLAVGGKNILKGGYNGIKGAYSGIKSGVSKLTKQNMIDFASKVKPMLTAAKNGTANIGKRPVEAIKKLYAALDKECKRVYGKYLDELTTGTHVLNDLDGFPSGLLAKLSNAGATKIKQWINNRAINYKAIDGTIVNGIGAETKIYSDIENIIGNKNVVDVYTDSYGRIFVRTDATAVSETKVISCEVTNSGDCKLFEFKAVYGKGGQAGYPPLSSGGLSPDFALANNSSDILFPTANTQKNTVKIKLSGKRNGVDGDFDRANRAANILSLIPAGKWKPNDYTWHHLDDFNPVTGECTMQLVKTTEHVKTLPHTGSVKQWENYNGITYGN